MIAAIERAIAARVRAADLGYTFGTLSSYDEAAEMLAEGRLVLPALWATYDGEQRPVRIGTAAYSVSLTSRIGTGCYQRTLDFTVSVAAQSWINVAYERGKEETGKPGAYQIAEDVWHLLADHDLGLPIRAIQPGDIRPDVPEAGVMIVNLAFTVEVTSQVPAPTDNIGEYLRHHTDWDVEPIGEVVPPLPANEADIRDDILVRTS